MMRENLMWSSYCDNKIIAMKLENKENVYEENTIA